MSTTAHRAAKRRRGICLCVAGWSAFALSLALPVTKQPFGSGWMSGWECFRFSFDCVWDAARGGGMWWYMAGCAVANGLFVASPWSVRATIRNPRLLRVFGVLLFASALYALRWLFDDGSAPLNAGYYSWLLSFVLVALGALNLAAAAARPAATAPKPPLFRTPEEMAALRELQDYLSGIVRVQTANTTADECRHGTAAGTGCAERGDG